MPPSQSPSRPALLMLVACLLAAPTASSAAMSQDRPSPGAVVVFNIPAQPLEQALVAYGQAANIQVAYDADLLHGQLSSAIVGRFPVRDALELMLRGTGLKVRYTNATGVTLASTARTPAPVLAMEAMRVQGAPVAPDQRRFVDFARKLEARIVAQLQQRRDATRFAFELTVRLWLQPDGRIGRIELVSANVPAERAEAVLTIIRATRGGESPPPDLPQPLPFRFYSRGGT